MMTVKQIVSTGRLGAWAPFVINLTLVIAIFIGAIYTGIFLNSGVMIESELRSRASAIFNSIVLARKWNTQYGGVYVEKTPGEQSNSYLENADVHGIDGKVYTKKNHALMTREMSDLASGESEFHFRITSLGTLLNPNNAPDAWERGALESLEKGSPEVFRHEPEGGSTWYRYVAPLRFEKTCEQCHDKRVGENIHGGISVRFNIDKVEGAVATNHLITGFLFFLTLSGLLAVIYRIVATLYRQIQQAQERIRVLAITDELTGLRNRRHLMETLDEEVARAKRYGRHLGCIMFDLDHFKRVNDLHGHLAGDAVLRAVGACVKGMLRSSDMAGRYGGEEFVLVLPETDRDAAASIAEKLRKQIETMVIAIPDDQTLQVTASFGAASLDAAATDDQAATAPILLNRADEALYRAKNAGRNRVELA